MTDLEAYADWVPGDPEPGRRRRRLARHRSAEARRTRPSAYDRSALPPPRPPPPGTWTAAPPPPHRGVTAPPPPAPHHGATAPPPPAPHHGAGRPAWSRPSRLGRVLGAVVAVGIGAALWTTGADDDVGIAGEVIEVAEPGPVPGATNAWIRELFDGITDTTADAGRPAVEVILRPGALEALVAAPAGAPEPLERWTILPGRDAVGPEPASSPWPDLDDRWFVPAEVDWAVLPGLAQAGATELGTPDVPASLIVVERHPTADGGLTALVVIDGPRGGAVRYSFAGALLQRFPGSD